jgi:hypothetical protein
VLLVRLLILRTLVVLVLHRVVMVMLVVHLKPTLPLTQSVKATVVELLRQVMPTAAEAEALVL